MSFDRGTTTRLSLSRFTRKFSFRNKEYNKVEDSYDTRIPVHNEDAFQYGLRFKAKYIGSLEIARPTSKIDIITAMRRIRYEYKVKGVRKKRCYIEMSVSGVKISKRKSKRSRKKYTEEQLFIMQHPIYRIFYVSHDSQDMKIFSYITREVPDNTFRCNVFKADKKRMALHVVRSLGQAFDICHKLNPKPVKKKKEEDGDKTKVEGEEEAAEGKEGGENKSPTGVPSHWKTFNTDIDTAMEKMSLEGGGAAKEKPAGSDDLLGLTFDPFATPAAPADVFAPNGSLIDPFQSSFTSTLTGDSSAVAHPPLTVSNLSTNLPDFPDGVDPATITVPPPHMAYFAMGGQRPPGFAGGQQTTIAENPFTSAIGREESPISIGEALTVVPEDKAVSGHQRRTSNPFKPTEDSSAWDLEKRQFVSDMALLREQLKSETSARLESQARVEHLLEQNKELINHLQKLMVQLQQLQSLGLQQQQQQQTPPPKTSTPTQQDDPSSSRGGGTPVATSAPSPPREPSPTSPQPAAAQQNVTSSSPGLDDGDVSLLPTLTSTPSPTPAQTSAVLTEEGGVGETAATTLPEVNGGTDIKLDTSDFGGLGSLDIDVNLLTTSTLPDDPFAPLPNTSNSVQLTSS